MILLAAISAALTTIIRQLIRLNLRRSTMNEGKMVLEGIHSLRDDSSLCARPRSSGCIGLLRRMLGVRKWQCEISWFGSSRRPPERSFAFLATIRNDLNRFWFDLMVDGRHGQHSKATVIANWCRELDRKVAKGFRRHVRMKAQCEFLHNITR